MTIEVYPSLLPGEPIERHRYAGTVGAWLDSKRLPWRSRPEQPISVTVNGTPLSVSDWDTLPIGHDDRVEIRPLPRGGILEGIGSIIGGVLDFAFGWLLPSTSAPDIRTPQGTQLEAADARANTAKLGSVVPELCGRYRRFPEYLTPPRRYFASPREQWLDFLVCIGPGHYQIDDADVKVGDTPISSLGDDADYTIYPPGEDLSSDPAHEHWYNVSEVGATSAGTAGLELSADPSSDVDPHADEFHFDAAAISVDSTGWFPASWGPGTMLDIQVPMTYSVSEEFDPIDEAYFNRFTGNFREIDPSPALPVMVSFASLPEAEYLIGNYSLDANFDGWVELVDPNTMQRVSGMPVGSISAVFRRTGRRYRVVTAFESEVVVEAVSGGVVESGWTGFPVLSSTDATITADPDTIWGEIAGPFVATPGTEKSTTFEVDIFFPNGLCFINDNGGLESRSVTVEIQYRDADAGGAWISVLKSYTDATLDQIGFTERFTLSAQRAEFRLRRFGARDTDTRVKDVVQWYGLRSRLATRTAYPNWTTMSVRLRGASKLAVRSENQINVVATRILPTLQSDGSWGSPQPTRDISAFVYHIAQSIGYTDADIDMDELQRLHGIWSARGDYADFVFDETTVREALAKVLEAGMAELAIEGGQIRPVRDEPRTVFEQAYSSQNMTNPLARTFRSIRVDDPDGVEVEFMNADTWTKDVVQCLLPGDTAVKIERVKLDTVTDRTRAWRIGMRRRRALRYRRWDYQFGTEMDALNSRYLSYVPLIDDTPGYGQSAILLAIDPHDDGALLRVSEPLEWEEGESHVVAYRDEDGKLVGPFAASPGSTPYEVIAPIPQPWPEVTLSQEPPHVYFGTLQRWTYPALITEIRPQGTDEVSVSATNYDDRVYADDDNTPS